MTFVSESGVTFVSESGVTFVSESGVTFVSDFGMTDFVIPGEDPGSILGPCPLQTASGCNGSRIKSGMTFVSESGMTFVSESGVTFVSESGMTVHMRLGTRTRVQ